VRLLAREGCADSFCRRLLSSSDRACSCNRLEMRKILSRRYRWYQMSPVLKAFISASLPTQNQN